MRICLTVLSLLIIGSLLMAQTSVDEKISTRNDKSEI